MIKNPAALEGLERRLIAGRRADLSRNYLILDALYEEAVFLGVFPLRDSLDGLDIDIKIARIINGVQKPA